jgi:hypothetical protein
MTLATVTSRSSPPPEGRPSRPPPVRGRADQYRMPIPNPTEHEIPIALQVPAIALPYMGLPLVDNANLAPISKLCAELNRWEFQVTVAPLIRRTFTDTQRALHFGAKSPVGEPTW